MCKTDKSEFHKIGVSFIRLLRLLDISVEIFTSPQKIEIISKSSLLEFGASDRCGNIAPVMTNEANNHELMVVKLLQTISFIKKLEESNYIMIYVDGEYKANNKPDIYDVYELVDPGLVAFTNKLVCSRILPSTALIELGIHDYITEDKRQYAKQVELSEQSINEAKQANEIAQASLQRTKISIRVAKWIAFFTCIASALIAVFVPTSLKEDSIHKLSSEISTVIHHLQK